MSGGPDSLHPLFLQAAPNKPFSAELLRYRGTGGGRHLRERWRLCRDRAGSVYQGLCERASPASEPTPPLILVNMFDIPHNEWVIRVPGHAERRRSAGRGFLAAQHTPDISVVFDDPPVTHLGYQVARIDWVVTVLYSPDLDVAMIQRMPENEWIMSTISPGDPDLSPFEIRNLSKLRVNFDPGPPGDTLDS